jgi:hypothetical protein
MVEYGKKERLTSFSMLVVMNRWWDICVAWLWLYIHRKVLRERVATTLYVVGRWVKSLVSLTEDESRHMECRRSAK